MKTTTTFLLLAAFAFPALAADPCGKNHYILDEPCAISATRAAIGMPNGITSRPNGEVYFTSQNVVFKIDSEGLLHRVAGNGTPGYEGDGKAAVDALLSFPVDYPEYVRDPIDFWEFAAGLTFDSAGNLYISDTYNNAIRKVSAADGTISTFVGRDAQRPSDRRLWAFSGFWWPQGLAVDSTDAVYVADQWGSLLRIPKEGAIETVYSYPVGIGVAAGIALDGDGSILVADALCSIVRVWRDHGSEVALKGERCDAYFQSKGADGLAWPYGVAIDLNGDMLVADTWNHCIRRYDSEKQLTTIAGTCGYRNSGFSGDGGPAIDARLNAPHGITVDAIGNILIADTNNRRIRRIASDGTIETIAGNGELLGALPDD